MNNILDYDNDNQKSTFAKLSFRNFLYALAEIAVVLLVSLLKLLHWIRGDYFDMLVGLSVLIILIFSILGLVQGIRSFGNQEPNSTKKYAGLIGNLVFVIL